MAKKNKDILDNVANDEVKPETASMDDLTETEEFPKPDEEAIAAMDAQRAAVPPQQNETEEFNPAIHRTGADGKPQLTKTGKFRKKTGLQKSPAFKNPETQAAGGPEVPPLTSRAAGELASGLIEQLSVTLVSDDFIYSDMERQSNVVAWEKCFDHYGGVNLSPPWALAANHAAIILARAHKPRTLSKISLGFAWIKSKFKRKKKENGALPDRGYDGKREDNMGAEKSA